MREINELQEALPALLEPEAAPEAILAYLEELRDHCQRFTAETRQGRSFSFSTIRQGQMLVDLAEPLSMAMEKRNLPALWIRALACWSMAMPPVVAAINRLAGGTLMYAFLRYHRRQGDEPGLLERCRAIVADFTVLLEEAEEIRAKEPDFFAGEIGKNDELQALAYLELAARELSAAGDANASALLQRLRALPPFWAKLML